MTVVAVIAEYNPLHTGHAYHLAEIRRKYGENAAIIVLLAGNFVQRGDAAICDKYARGQAALACGADLVLELPFPFSAAPAEIYAESAIAILTKLGCVQKLSFGSECGELPLLEKAAEVLTSPHFEKEVRRRIRKEHSRGYAAACADIYAEATQDATLLSTPNNILGIQYLCALRRLGSSIQPETILRESDYHTGAGKYPSASSLREKILHGDLSALSEMPKDSARIFSDEMAKGCAPGFLSQLSPVLLSALRLAPPPCPDSFFDAGGGLGSRLLAAAEDCYEIEEWLEKARAPHDTKAHIRRAALHLYLQTTSAEMHSSPAYTQLLAVNKTGQKLLRCIKARGEIPVLTKPADHVRLPSEARAQFLKAQRADSLYLWSLPRPQNALHPLRRTPYCEK